MSSEALRPSEPTEPFILTVFDTARLIESMDSHGSFTIPKNSVVRLVLEVNPPGSYARQLLRVMPLSADTMVIAQPEDSKPSELIVILDSAKRHKLIADRDNTLAEIGPDFTLETSGTVSESMYKRRELVGQILPSQSRFIDTEDKKLIGNFFRTESGLWRTDYDARDVRRLQLGLTITKPLDFTKFIKPK